MSAQDIIDKMKSDIEEKVPYYKGALKIMEIEIPLFMDPLMKIGDYICVGGAGMYVVERKRPARDRVYVDLELLAWRERNANNNRRN